MTSTHQHKRGVLLWLAIIFWSLDALAEVSAPCASIEERLNKLLKAQEEMRSEPSANVRLSPQQLKLRAKLEEEIKQQYAALAACREKNPTTPAKPSGTGNEGNQAPAPTHQGALPSSPGTFSSDEELFAYQDSYPENPYAKRTPEYRAEESRRMREWKQKHPNWALEQARKKRSASERAEEKQIEIDNKTTQDRNAQDPTYLKRKAEADAKLKASNDKDPLSPFATIAGSWTATLPDDTWNFNRSAAIIFNSDGSGVLHVSTHFRSGGAWEMESKFRCQAASPNEWLILFETIKTLSGDGRLSDKTWTSKATKFSVTNGKLTVDRVLTKGATFERAVE